MRLILIGFGNVGKALLRSLIDKRNPLNRLGLRPRIVAVLDRGGGAVDPDGLDPAELLRTDEREGTVAAAPEVGQFGLSPLTAIKEVEAEIVLELTTTNPDTGEPGISHVEAALRNGRHVITTNKGPPALAMRTLQNLAELNNVEFRFSGTVGGGTPILEFVKQIAKVDILSLKAILNGTTNYILTQMYDFEASIEEALKKAQRLGYAEKDPSLDIYGIDSALKLTIISNYALDQEIALNEIHVTGINDVTLEEVRRYKRKGQKLKLVCSIDKEATVSPQPIEASQPICVDGSLNSVQLETRYTGKVTLIGPGAGGYPTASAIINDLLALEGKEQGAKRVLTTEMAGIRVN
ncbi:homoserine dehydrogenase [Candidatus Bathyarchaeota archaeon]|nr:homoserine dehydrogenase [Candidatus Bathyarchaeota archaeon]